MKREKDKKRSAQGGLVRKVDWLAFAIGHLGGCRPAARRLNVPLPTIYNWLENGLANVDFAKVAALSKLADTPLEYLAHRTGPWQGFDQTQKTSLPGQTR